MIDPKYKKAGRNITAIIAAMPLVLGLGWMLLQRLMGWKEQKVPKIKTQDQLR